MALSLTDAAWCNLKLSRTRAAFASQVAGNPPPRRTLLSAARLSGGAHVGAELHRLLGEVRAPRLLVPRHHRPHELLRVKPLELRLLELGLHLHRLHLHQLLRLLDLRVGPGKRRVSGQRKAVRVGDERAIDGWLRR